MKETNTTATSIASFWQFQCITDACSNECINKENYSYCANILTVFRHNEKLKRFFFTQLSFFFFLFSMRNAFNGTAKQYRKIRNIKHTAYRIFEYSVKKKKVNCQWLFFFFKFLMIFSQCIPIIRLFFVWKCTGSMAHITIRIYFFVYT